MNSSALHLVAPAPSRDGQKDPAALQPGRKGFLLGWLSKPGRLISAEFATAEAEADRLHPQIEAECAARGMPGRYPNACVRNAINKIRFRVRQSGKSSQQLADDYLRDFIRKWGDSSLPPFAEALQIKELLVKERRDYYPHERIVQTIEAVRQEAGPRLPQAAQRATTCMVPAIRDHAARESARQQAREELTRVFTDSFRGVDPAKVALARAVFEAQQRTIETLQDRNAELGLHLANAMAQAGNK